jgi:serine/threonine protein kinase
METKASISDFETMCTLGKGSFGTVNLVRHIKTQALFAVKIIEKSRISSSTKQIAHIINERDILKKLASSYYCVHISDTFQDEVNLYLLMEYLPGGELIRLIQKNRFIQEGQDLKFYVAEVIAGVEYLHGQNIVYRDLKPDNILLDAAGHIRLIDFGFSK